MDDDPLKLDMNRFQSIVINMTLRAHPQAPKIDPWTRIENLLGSMVRMASKQRTSSGRQSCCVYSFTFSTWRHTDMIKKSHTVFLFSFCSDDHRVEMSRYKYSFIERIFFISTCRRRHSRKPIHP